MKRDIIFDIIAIILIVIMIIIALIMLKQTNKVYVQKWISPDTSVCYLITNSSIIEMHNADGTIHIE